MIDPVPQEELSYLLEYKPLIEEWIILKSVIKGMSQILKKQGKNKKTIELSKALLNEKWTVGKTVASSESL